MDFASTESKTEKQSPNLAPVSLIVYVVSHSNTYKPDAGMSDFKMIVLLFTDKILIRDGNLFECHCVTDYMTS